MFQVGQQVWAAKKAPTQDLQSAHQRLVNDHGNGPFNIIGTHPKGLDGEQLVYLGSSSGKTMVDGGILRQN